MRTLKRIIIVMLIMLMLAGGGIIYFGLHSQYEIKWVIRGAIKAFEQEDIGKLMSYIATSYSDDHGFDYPMVRRFLAGLFKDFDKLDVIMENPVVKIDGDSATVQLSLWIATDWKNSEAYIVGTNQAGAAVRIYLSKAGWTWKVVRIEGVR